MGNKTIARAGNRDAFKGRKEGGGKNAGSNAWKRIFLHPASMSPRPSGCDFSFSADESPFFPRIPPLPLLGGAERERRQTPGAGKNFPWKRARAIPAKNPKLLAAQCFPTTPPLPSPLPLENAFPELLNNRTKRVQGWLPSLAIQMEYIFARGKRNKNRKERKKRGEKRKKKKKELDSVGGRKK